MPSNAVSSVDVPLSIFGGLVTELSPPDLPEGASPANRDMVFRPGSAETRSGLNRIFAVPVSSLGPFSYEKSFVLPNGNIKNLYLTQGDGILWVEDVTNTPGMAVQLFQSAGATYASSCTASGREYIMLSDGQYGADIPLQYDGTNLWRVTQDGPGAPPVVQSVPLPPSTLALSIPAGLGVASINTSGFVFRIGGGGWYQSITVSLTMPTTVLAVGQSVTITGNSYAGFNSTFTIGSLILNSSGQAIGFTAAQYNAAAHLGAGGTIAQPGKTLVRSGNTVTANTATPHSLLKGYQAQISGAGTTQIGGGIVSIVLNNEDNPGIATVITNMPHGLLPNNIVTMAGIVGAAVGGGIATVARNAQIVTVTTTTHHGLQQGSEVTIAGVANATFNGTFSVLAAPSTTTFTYYQFDVDATSTGGTVTYNWPLASVNPAQNFFTVQTAPTATSFTISLSYTDGTWTGGTISFAWDGIFFVTAVISPTQFQYQQYGPNASTTQAGTVTPYGQATPGIHQCQVCFLLASGSITQPSPSTTFVANGGQYLSISRLPLGPGNCVGRILLFTGAGGAYFFYIPTPAQVNGLQVSTATQINDNSTDALIIDFSDNTLYAASAASIPGNNLASQVVLGPCSGVFSYASRLIGWGERNKVQNFLNMGFGGGSISPQPTLPLGWTFLGPTGALQALLNPLQVGWQLQPAAGHYGHITQSAYLDAYGAPILLGNTQYSFRFRASYNTASNGSVVAVISSPTVGVIATAIVNLPSTAGQGWFQADFSAMTPQLIPSDAILEIYGNEGTPGQFIILNELELIYTAQPYLNNRARISYAENFEGLSALTGILGSADDTSPIRNFGVIRQTLYLVSGTGLHETADNGQTEPSGWTVDQVADNCGAFSVASVARNPQGIGSAGKDWMMWAGPDGAQIFTGQKPIKVSQEIQQIWDAIPAANAYQCWVKNYESAKWCFFGIPVPGSSMQVMVLDYRNLDGEAIASNPPIHISFTGKMIVSDLTRKWTSWTIPAWCGELMYRNTIAQPQIVFGCLTPSGGANAYTLNPLQFHDDDYGVIPASYTTFFFVAHEMEQALQLGSHRHIYTLAQAFISGVGSWSLTPLAASLNNQFPASPQFPLSDDPFFDIDFGINVNTTRCAFTIQASPLEGSLDSYFKLQKLVIDMARDPNAPVRGSVTGSY